VADFVPCVRPKGNAGYGPVSSSGRKVERHVELDGRALRLVGGHRDGSVELTEKTLDDLEAEACPRLVDIEILWEADSLIRDLDLQISAALFARDMEAASKRISEPRNSGARTLGQPVIIENVTGAAGNIGVGRVARATPDGYTLVAGFWGTHVVNGAIYALPYDVVNDFEAIVLMSRNAQVIVARKTLLANDLKGFIAWLKANPDVATAGTAGAGSPQHVMGVLFQNSTSTRFRFIPYRGGAPAMQDLIAGQIDLIFADQTTSLPQVHGGDIKAYAVTGKSAGGSEISRLNCCHDRPRRKPRDPPPAIPTSGLGASGTEDT
jgi:hypothetical protein